MKMTKLKKSILIGMAAFMLSLPAQAFAADLPLALPEVQQEAQAVEASYAQVRYAIVLCDTNYREMPSETAQTAGQAHIGEELEVYAVNINGQWNAVMDEEEKMVYIHSSAVSITAPTVSQEDHSDLHITDGGENGYPGEVYNDKDYLTLMAEATKYIGMPYVWGGSTPETSFDCSGYVCWVLNNAGIYKIGRTTAQGIYNSCKEISREEARPGDLIFFQKTHDTTSDVTHVGIYVGNGKMLHCGKPIGYSSIDTPYWTEHFYAFGRLK